MDPTPPGSLEQEVRELRARVQRLELALSRQGMLAQDWPAAAPAAGSAPPWSAPQAAVPQAPSPAQSSRTTPSVVPGSATVEQGGHKPGRSLESRIGSQWFNRIGILAVLIGMAWFLKFAIDNQWIGPLGRVLIGLLSGAGIIAWSERFRAHGYAVFSYSLKSVGSGILYLALWAAFSLYHLVPGSAAFLAMIAVTAFNGFLSWTQNSELLAVYAIAGGFSTPLLVSTGENHEIELFGYMLVLDVTVLLLVALRPWSRLLFGAYLGTVSYAAGWAMDFYSARQFATTTFYFACFFLLFALAPRLACIDPTAPSIDVAEATPGWDKLATVLLPILNAGLGFLSFYWLLDSKRADWAKPWLAVAFAGFYLALLRLPARGRWRRSPFLLSELHLTSAVVFLTIAIPLKASGRWITIGWLAEGAALLWLAARTRSTFLRVLALLSLALALVALLTANPYAAPAPVLNQRFATYMFAIAVCSFTAWQAHRFKLEADSEFNRAWPAIAATSALIVNCLILIAISLEIHAFWSRHGRPAGFAQIMQNRIYTQFSYSAFFMTFGAILLVFGFSKHSAFLRWQALVLLAFSIAKVFIVDVSQLSQGYRILSFLGLGALLLGVSFVYQRDWFHLREHGDNNP